MNTELETYQIYLENRNLTLEEWRKFLTPEHANDVADAIGIYSGTLDRRNVFDIIVAYEGGITSGEDIRALLIEVYGLYL